MNLISLIFIGLIFISLIVIIIIFGKNAKKINLKAIEKEARESGGEERKRNPIAGFFVLIFSKIKQFFIVIAEWFVKKIKKLLHLIHFWLIKTKKGKNGNGVQDEIEAKEELLIEEEKNLDTVINEDLANVEEEAAKKQFTAQEEFIAEKMRLAQKSTEAVDTTPEIAESPQPKPMISETAQQEAVAEGNNLEVIADETEERVEIGEPGAKKGFFGRLFGKKKKEEIKGVDYVAGDATVPMTEESFSDGVVKVEKHGEEDNENILNDVVTIQKTEGLSDDELGVDKEILEKKILQKVEKNPRNTENYRELGELYIRMGNYEDAEESYKFILQIAARDADARRKLEKIKLLKRLK